MKAHEDRQTKVEILFKPWKGRGTPRTVSEAVFAFVRACPVAKRYDIKVTYYGSLGAYFFKIKLVGDE